MAVLAARIRRVARKKTRLLCEGVEWSPGHWDIRTKMFMKAVELVRAKHW